MSERSSFRGAGARGGGGRGGGRAGGAGGYGYRGQRGGGAGGGASYQHQHHQQQQQTGGQGGQGGQQQQQQQEKPKKENILDLTKYMEKEVSVKFNGGREGQFFLLFAFYPLFYLLLFNILFFFCGQICLIGEVCGLVFDPWSFNIKICWMDIYTHFSC